MGGIKPPIDLWKRKNRKIKRLAFVLCIISLSIGYALGRTIV